MTFYYYQLIIIIYVQWSRMENLEVRGINCIDWAPLKFLTKYYQYAALFFLSPYLIKLIFEKAIKRNWNISNILASCFFLGSLNLRFTNHSIANKKVKRNPCSKKIVCQLKVLLRNMNNIKYIHKCRPHRHANFPSGNKFYHSDTFPQTTQFMNTTVIKLYKAKARCAAKME